MWNMCRETGIWLVMALKLLCFKSWGLRLQEPAESKRDPEDPTLMSLHIVRPLLVPARPTVTVVMPNLLHPFKSPF